MELIFPEGNTATKEQLIEITKVLMDDHNEKHQELLKLKEQLKAQEKELALLKEQSIIKDDIISKNEDVINQLRMMLNNRNRKLFGKSSEKVDVNQLSFDLFNDVEVILKEAKQPKIKKLAQKKLKKLHEQVKEKVTETVDYKEDIVCEHCNSLMEEFKYDTNHTIKYIPATFEVIENHVYSYKCSCCEDSEGKTIIRKAQGPDQLIPKSVVSPSLMSHIINEKYNNHMPVDRLEKKFSNEVGFDISKQNMCNWMKEVCDNHLSKVYYALLGQFNQSKIAHCDESPIPVIRSSKNNGQKPIQAYMWVVTTGKDEEHKIVLYKYSNDRKYSNAKELLKDFSGYLIVDGYDAYKGLNNVTLIVCLAHVRRYYEEALSYIPDDKKLLSNEFIGLDFCNRLFALDQERPTDILAKRKAILDEFKEWLDVICLTTQRKTPLAKAITYTFNQWEYIYNITLEASLEVSNNRCERAIRPFTIGRKNYMFYFSEGGANIGSVLYTIVETAKLNRLNVFKYLDYLMSNMSSHNYNDDMLEDLLPTSKKLPSSLYIES